MVVRDGWKLLHDRTVDVRALYDLRSDPGERTNRVNDEVERAAELGALLDAWRTEMDRAAESAAGSEPAYTRDETRLLRALGYGD